MKHFGRIALTVLTILLLLTLWASADVLWEPLDNAYYWTSAQSCDTVTRIYGVPDGMTVNIYQSPMGGRRLTTLEAGTRLYVGFSTTVGNEVWGVGYPLGQYDTEGWFRLGRLQLEYGHPEFVEDFAADIIQNPPDILTADMIEDTIYTWTYPGSGHGDGTIPAEALGGGYNDGVVDFISLYTDPDGGRWGYVGYYMGHCGWVWLDDPENPEPPLHTAVQPENTVTDTSPEEAAPGLGLIIGLVAAAAVVTAVLILLLKRRRQKQ